MKDPAVLIYFDKWIASTNGMKASFRGWYFDLLIYQYDKGPIPNDMDELAGICRVRPSEYDDFKQVVKQVLEQKFKQNDNQMWVNEFASEILRKRELFTEKRKMSGNIGVVIKLAKSIRGFNAKYLKRLKDSLFGMNPEEINKHKHKQVLEQVLKLYIDVDVNEDKGIIKGKDIYRQFKHLKITNVEFGELKKTYTIIQIDAILDSIENYRKNNNYVSLYQTAIKWLAKEKPNEQNGQRLSEPITTFENDWEDEKN